MPSIREFVFRFKALFRKRRLEDEMAEEMRHHLELRTERNVAAGMSSDEARYAARRNFGGIEQIKESARDYYGFTWISHLMQDLRFGLRQMRKSPSFTIIATLSLALGIGVNLAIFSVIDAFAFRPVPGIGDPDGIVFLRPWGDISYPEFEYLRDQNQVFSNIAGLVPSRGLVSLAGLSGSQKSAGDEEFIPNLMLVSANYFSVLQSDSGGGRTFLPEEDKPSGAHPVIIVSYQFWQHRFNSDPELIGKTLLLNNVAFTVIGIGPAKTPMEPGTIFPPSAWIPLSTQDVLQPGNDALHATEQGSMGIHVFGRLKSGVTLSQANAEMKSLDRQFSKEFLKTPESTTRQPYLLGRGCTLLPQKAEVTAIVAGIMSVVSIVLLIACSNVANLLLARATTRQREISVRLTLGASRGRVVRQLLTESLIVAIFGGAFGLLVSIWIGNAIWAAIATTLPEGIQINLGFDWRLFTYAVVASFATGIIFGVAPALEATKSSLNSALKQENVLLGHRISRSRLRSLLVIGQVAVTLGFLILASLILRSVLRQSAQSFAFETKRVFFAQFAVAPNGFAATHRQEFQRMLLERVESMPGVKSASIAKVWYAKYINPQSILVDGRSPAGIAGIAESSVPRTYFETLNLPFIRGRNFTDEEVRNETNVLIVSETFARSVWPNVNPLGRRLKINDDSEAEVVGVVKDGVREVRNRWELRPYSGDIYAPRALTNKMPAELWVQTEGSPGDAMRAVIRETLQLDSSIRVQTRNLNSIFEMWTGWMQLVSEAIAVLGTLALVLALMGIYGVMAFAVSQRTHEVGVRMAMGATQPAILRLMLREGMKLVAWGVVLGAAGSAAIAWIARALLYGLSPFDPVTFGGISILLGGAALLACYIPARSATRVDPMVALRYE